MYLFNNGVLVKECPAPVHHLSVSDDGDMIRIITNPDHLESDTVHELLATLAAGLYCKINPKANFDKSFALNMMVAVLSRIVKIERHTMQEIEAK